MAPLRIDATALFELLDALPHAVWVEDATGRIVHRNAAARRGGALDAAGPPAHRVPVRVRDGQRGEVELRLAFASLPAERLDADLLRLLCSASSQDLRNIRQVVAMVRDALEGPDGGTASLPLAISALERTLEWGQDLLSVLRVVAPGIRRGGVVDALRVFRAASTLGRTMTEGIPKVRIDVDGSGAWVRADARLLARTFLELVLAACDSARASGAQALSVRALLEDPGHLRIDVRRDGGAVPDDPLVAAADRMREGGPLRIPGTVVALERDEAGVGLGLRLVFPLGPARDRPPATVAFVGGDLDPGSFTYHRLPAGAGVRWLRVVDLDGDGRGEIVARLAERRGDLLRELVAVYRATSRGGLERVVAQELVRERAGRRVEDAVRLVRRPRGRGYDLVVDRPRTRGFTERSYRETPATDAEPVLVPWAGPRRRRFRFGADGYEELP